MTKIKLSGKAYDILKWVSLVFIPALGTLYQFLGGLWNLPFIEEIKSTCLIFGWFLGTIIGVSTAEFRKDNQGQGELSND